MTPTHAKKRLAALRREIRAERISYGEIAELQNLVPYIEPGDVELAEWAGIPEVDFHSGAYRTSGYDASARTAELQTEEDAIFAERKAHESHGGAAGSFYDEGCTLCLPDDEADDDGGEGWYEEPFESVPNLSIPERKAHEVTA